jgi:hypothetical protein
MNTRTPATLLSLSAVALVSAGVESAAAVTDPCFKPVESVCPPEPQRPPDMPEHKFEPAHGRPGEVVQAPPSLPRPPPGSLMLMGVGC